MDALGEVPHDLLLAIGKSHSLGIDYLGAAARTLRRFHFDGAQSANLVAPFGAKSAQPLQPPDIALTPARDAVTYPILLGGNAPLQLVALDFLLFQHLIAPAFERAKASLQPVSLAAIQPDGGAGKIFQEAPVMADQDQRALAGLDLAFQPFDGAY